MVQLPCLIIKMQIIILCGGKATRLSSLLGDTPKMLAKVNNVPFLDYIFDFLLTFESIHKITLLTGVGSEEIEEYVKKKYSNADKVIEICKDNLSGQGTSQALNQAFNSNVLEKDFLLMYGDSLPDLDLDKFIKEGISCKSPVYFSYIDKKYVDEDCRIEEVGGRIKYYADLSTKTYASSSNLFIDYGVYYISMNQDLQSLIANESDLKNVLEKFSANSVCLGYEVLSPFIEIGNPISFASASDKLRMHFSNE